MFEAVAGPSMGERFGGREAVIVLSWVLLSPSVWASLLPSESSTSLMSTWGVASSRAVFWPEMGLCSRGIWIICSSSHTKSGKPNCPWKNKEPKRERSIGLLIVNSLFTEKSIFSLKNLAALMFWSCLPLKKPNSFKHNTLDYTSVFRWPSSINRFLVKWEGKPTLLAGVSIRSTLGMCSLTVVEGIGRGSFKNEITWSIIMWFLRSHTSVLYQTSPSLFKLSPYENSCQGNYR